MGALFLSVAIVCEVAATMILRLTTGETPRWWALPIAVVGYVLAFAALQRCLDGGFPLGIAYAIWGGVGVIAVAALSFLLYRESMTPVQIIGIALVIVGILCLELGKAPDAHAAASPAAAELREGLEPSAGR
ncbi:multidrug efflux SMR transporter [Arthrobacter sp. AZCC_0090]|uniref:DMT family transporter n=1 Tax=Arthrobacter sp. AZCC_0090 TaxID=2735881 RepID=UPI00160742AF|nr:multidrug efflux SMR transporter [Arthrobacter sp. AZCC_0090]MBB6407101.1 small multidrug resistance pump [Arthrobacter sp. AZCC_0090]